MTGARVALGFFLLALAFLSCSRGRTVPSGPPASAEQAAVALFALAQDVDAARDDIVRIVDEGSIADEAELRDAMSLLRGLPAPDVLGVEELSGLDRVAVDLEVSVPGGRAGRYSVQAVRQADTTFRVVWFEGPAVSWPGHARPRGGGLTTSPPPGAPNRD